MHLLFDWLISNALVASALVFFALIIGRLCPRRPALVHACWLLVFVKLVTPPLFSVAIPKPHMAQLSIPSIDPPTSRTSGSPSLSSTTPAEPTGADQLTDWELVDLLLWLDAIDAHPDAGSYTELSPVIPSERGSSGGSSKSLCTSSGEIQKEHLPEPTEVQPAQPEQGMLLTAWRGLGTWLQLNGIAFFLVITLAGSMAILLTTLLRVRRFQQLLQQEQPTPIFVAQQMKSVGSELQLETMPQLVLVAGRVGPLLWQGWGRAMVILPVGLVERITLSELRTVLAHELTHYRRGDHLWRYLELAALTFYWWLPWVWLASRRLRQAEEECCDAGVVASLPELAGSYATALVRSLTYVTEPSSPCPILTSGLGPVTLLKRRLTMMRVNVERRLGLRGWLMLLAVAGVVMPVGFSWASDDDPPPARSSAGREAERARRPGSDRGDERPRRDRRDTEQEPPVAVQPPAGTPSVPRSPAARSLPPSTDSIPPVQPTPMSPMSLGSGFVSEEANNNAEMALKQAELELKIRRVKVRQSESELRLYEAEVDRSSKAARSGAVPSSEVAIAQARLESARSNVELAQIEVERAQLTVDQARRRMESMRRLRGGMTAPAMGGAASTPVPFLNRDPGPVGPGSPEGGVRSSAPRGGRPGSLPEGGGPGGVGAPGAFPGGPGGSGRGGAFGGPPGGGPPGSGAGVGSGPGFGQGPAGLGGGSGGGRGAGRVSRNDVAPPSERSEGGRDPRDQRIKELEDELREMRKALEEVRSKRREGEGIR